MAWKAREREWLELGGYDLAWWFLGGFEKAVCLGDVFSKVFGG